tara:strand:- start:303 stop:764 length:462 start_codon:yes stop_codon:yes gene_type:complete
VRKKIKENYLVCVDDSNEFLDALNYACFHAEKNSMGIILLYVIELENFRHWQGVENIMQKEQENKAKSALKKIRKVINNKYKITIKNIIKRGEKVDKIIEVLNDEKIKINILILGLSLLESDTNKIISSLTGSFRRKLSLPITIVPGKIKNGE